MILKRLKYRLKINTRLSSECIKKLIFLRMIKKEKREI
jgi:hypothetical protein